MHKVERPALVRLEVQRHRRANPNGALAPAASAHYQPLMLVQPVNPLAVDSAAFPAQQHKVTDSPTADAAQPTLSIARAAHRHRASGDGGGVIALQRYLEVLILGTATVVGEI
jgi:hypothetical protein